MTKKSLGQNFLIDHNVAKKIIRIISKYKKHNIIEVGPGRGFLTDYLIKQNPNKVFLIEKDYNLFLFLKDKYKNFKNIKIYNHDALDTKIIDLVSKPKIIVFLHFYESLGSFLYFCPFL